MHLTKSGATCNAHLCLAVGSSALLVTYACRGDGIRDDIWWSRCTRRFRITLGPSGSTILPRRVADDGHSTK